MWSDHNEVSHRTVLGIFLTLIIETHCLPSSIFIEHLQCTRHNRTYRKHCPCSWGAYILKEKKKYTSFKMAFLFGVFCKVLRKYSVGVSFGNDLAPSLLEEGKRKGFQGRLWQTIQGRISREINTSSTKESWAVGRRMREAVGCKQRKRGILDRVEPERSCGLFPNTWPTSRNGRWQDRVKRKWSCAPDK